MGIAICVILAILFICFLAGRGSQKNARTVAKAAVTTQRVAVATPVVAAKATVVTLDAAKKGRELASEGLNVAHEKSSEAVKTIKTGAEIFGAQFREARKQLLIEKGLVEAPAPAPKRRNRKKGGRTTPKAEQVAV